MPARNAMSGTRLSTPRRSAWTFLAAGGTLLLVGAPLAAAQTDGATPDQVLVQRLRAADPAQRHVRLDGVTIQLGEPGVGGQDLALDLHRFDVVTPGTRFQLGNGRPWSYDRDRVRAYRGVVAGHPDSRTFIVVSPTGGTGYVDLDGHRHWISTRPRPAGAAQVADPLPGVPRCGVLDTAEAPLGAARRATPEVAAGVALPAPLTSTRVFELAIETDYELFSLFGDVDATADHVVEVYAAVSDIYQRDVNARFVLTFVRIWDTPDDLFNEPDPLTPFRNYWNQNMKDVPRDVAQFFSGRRNLPYGGVAYLSALCGSAAYSVVGYALGVIPDLDAPSVYHFDVPITAHELGHNFGANHTHAYGLDNCDQLDNNPQRGTIMSYCSQTVSGSNAITDLRFHSFVGEQMREYFPFVSCATVDCNGNGIEDAQEIADGVATDLDGDGVPDDCQDCNGNGVLDSTEIAAGQASDLNGNGVPDACEPDCNGNGIPDDVDIASGDSTDLWANGVPDECETDCNGNGVSDYSEIQVDLSLDIDRNTLLDACEDCDGDGITDLAARDGAWDAWVACHDPTGLVHRFHTISGVRSGLSETGAAEEGNDLVITADRRVLVSCGPTNRVVELAPDGSVVGDLVAPGAGGLADPAGLSLGSDGFLYVASRGSSAVLRYDLVTGAFDGVFVAAGAGGLTAPFGLAFGPDGDLFVNGADNRVRRYDGATGSFVGVFVQAANNGGLSDPRGMVFLPNGDLVVASRLTNGLLRYDGVTGAFAGKFNNGGTTTALPFDEPWGVRIGPNGNVYAVRHHPGEPSGPGGGLLHGDIAELHVNAARVYEFDVDTGNFLRSYITGHDTDIWSPTGIDFMPGEATDCNRNGLPDGCDIMAGRSADANGNGVPDECESLPNPDLDGNGTVDGADLGILLAAWGPCAGCPADLNGDGVVDGADLGMLLAAWG